MPTVLPAPVRCPSWLARVLLALALVAGSLLRMEHAAPDETQPVVPADPDGDWPGQPLPLPQGGR